MNSHIKNGEKTGRKRQVRIRNKKRKEDLLRDEGPRKRKTRKASKIIRHWRRKTVKSER